jgi:hypothetical protein
MERGVVEHVRLTDGIQGPPTEAVMTPVLGKILGIPKTKSLPKSVTHVSGTHLSISCAPGVNAGRKLVNAK